MSEFQSPDSVRKIIGADDGDTQSLIQRVRKQPFAVVLLDEFEKAHWNVWDLFLQVVRRYRFEPSPLVRDARSGWRSGRVRDVMAGNFDLFSASAAESEAGAR